jgi:hypothetical protein
MRKLSLSLLVAASVACGPPKPVSDGGPGETSGSTGSTTVTSGQTEAETDPGDGDGDGDGDSGGTSTSYSSDTCLFFPCSDVSNISECDPWMQDCPEGEKCVPYASGGGFYDSNKCVPITGDGAVGEPCTYGGMVEATDDCDATGVCWDGTCHGFCTGTVDAPACPDGHSCVISSDPVVTLCFANCDPVAQDCGEGLGCGWVNSEFVCLFEPERSVPVGQPCEGFSDCQSGGICLVPGSIPNCEALSCCAAYCDLGLGDAPCAVTPGTACVPFFPPEEAPMGYEHVGVCILP